MEGLEKSIQIQEKRLERNRKISICIWGIGILILLAITATRVSFDLSDKFILAYFIAFSVWWFIEAIEHKNLCGKYKQRIEELEREIESTVSVRGDI